MGFGAVMDIFAMVSGFFAAAKHSPKLEKYAKWIALVNVLAIGVVGTAIAILQHSWLEIVPVIGAVFQTVSLWCDEEQTIRKGRNLKDMTLAEMDAIWDEGKAKGL